MTVKSNINFEDIVSSEILASKYIKEKNSERKENSIAVASLFVAVQYLIDPDTKLVSYIFLWFIFYFFIYFFLYKRLLRNTLKKNGKIRKNYSINFTVNDKSIGLNYPDVSIEINWSSITDFREDTNNLYILFGNYSSYFILKKDFENSSIEESEYLIKKIRNKAQNKEKEDV
ncbi:YcxB family protein [Marinilactibacillus kalidii]|uniref:YcxB family protein n=1 Tax=Marinilactibacillus kalidii TaxID=2820274 RepID=UPI001ABEA6C4|nr:YcxB family protein [Marinilactibacillus kalidii]